MDERIQYFTQDQNGVIKRVEKTSQNEANWIHLSEPSEREIVELSTQFQLPLDFFTSAFDPDELARKETIERESGETATLIVINYPKPTNETHQYVTRALSIVGVGDSIITAAEEFPAFLSDDIGTLQRSWLNLQDSVQFTLKVVRDIAAQYIDYLKVINQLADTIEQQIIVTSKTEYLINMMYLKKSLVYFNTAIDTNHVVIKELADIEHISDHPERRALIHDVQIETLQAERMSEQTLLLLEHISDMVSSILSNNVNRVMKLLTSLTLLLTIPTLIGSMWGMNVPVPGQEHPVGFGFLLFIIILVTSITYVWLKKRDFL